jgi:hypothetical protein
MSDLPSASRRRFGSSGSAFSPLSVHLSRRTLDRPDLRELLQRQQGRVGPGVELRHHPRRRAELRVDLARPAGFVTASMAVRSSAVGASFGWAEVNEPAAMAMQSVSDGRTSALRK